MNKRFKVSLICVYVACSINVMVSLVLGIYLIICTWNDNFDGMNPGLNLLCTIREDVS